MPDPAGATMPESESALDLLRLLPLSVVVVGAAHEGVLTCSTATATYVTVDPARLAVSLVVGGSTDRAVRDSGRCSVSILDAEHAELAHRGAGSARSADAFAELGLAKQDPPDEFAAPAVAGCPAAWCVVTDRLRVGDNHLYVAQVIAYHADRVPAAGMVRYRRRYRAVGLSSDAPQDERYPL